MISSLASPYRGATLAAVAPRRAAWPNHPRRSGGGRVEPRVEPLFGVRVVDTAEDRGELCARLLADLGADVVRVEPPTGSASRGLPPFAREDAGSLHFALRNAGERAIRLDLDSGAGRARFDELLDRADVWIDSSDPGSL